MTDQGLLTALNERVRQEIGRVIGREPVALLDFPNHGNPGDSAIFLGALASLSALGCPPPVYMSESRTFDERLLRRVLPTGTILLMGGGNLGDLWPDAQVFRERVIRAFPDHAIVQLPQTIQFSDPATLARARTVFTAHRNFIILVRDRRSLAIATETLACRASLCPDLAFALSPAAEPALAAASGNQVDTLHLLRTDHESTGLPLDGRGTSIDWVADEPRSLTRVARRLGDYLVRARSAQEPSIRERLAQQALAACYTTLARRRLQRGSRLLRSSRVVVTDRLHGHIIALLLDIPHVLVGDRNGKLRDFVQAWSSSSAVMRWADAPGDVPALIRDLLDRRGSDRS